MAWNPLRNTLTLSFCQLRSSPPTALVIWLVGDEDHQSIAIFGTLWSGMAFLTAMLVSAFANDNPRRLLPSPWHSPCIYVKFTYKEQPPICQCTKGLCYCHNVRVVFKSDEPRSLVLLHFPLAGAIHRKWLGQDSASCYGTRGRSSADLFAQQEVFHLFIIAAKYIIFCIDRELAIAFLTDRRTPANFNFMSGPSLCLEFQNDPS